MPRNRNFPDFIAAYTDYMDNGFAPRTFHNWTAISLVAASMERKCYIPWGSTAFYPNLFILLVSQPGMGKSSAIMPGFNLIRDMNRQHKCGLKILPNQITEAKLIEIMRHPASYMNGITRFHCSGYFVCSEASSGLRDLYGNFINTITSFYDCDPHWEKATVGMGDETYKLVNVCFNVLAGCTNDYLGRLVTHENLEGGFASRCTYITHDETVRRSSKWQNRGTPQQDPKIRPMLMEDLASIQKMCGSFEAELAFADRWDNWWPEQDYERQKLDSAELQTIRARQADLFIKLCMVKCAAESGDMILKLSHWDWAMEMTESVTKDLEKILMKTQAKQVNTQKGVLAAIKSSLLRGPKKKSDLVRHVLQMGYDSRSINLTLQNYQIQNSEIEIQGQFGGNPTIKLLGNSK